MVPKASLKRKRAFLVINRIRGPGGQFLRTHQLAQIPIRQLSSGLGPARLVLGGGHAEQRTHLVEAHATSREPRSQMGQVTRPALPPGRRSEPWRQRHRGVGPATPRARSPRSAASPRAAPTRHTPSPARRLGSSAPRRPGRPAPSVRPSRGETPAPCVIGATGVERGRIRRSDTQHRLPPRPFAVRPPSVVIARRERSSPSHQERPSDTFDRQ